MNPRLSKTTTYHYIKFAWRTLLFLAVLAIYIANKVLTKDSDPLFEKLEDNIYIIVILSVICAIFVVEMLFRFFPSRLESPGCQKQFKRNFIPKEPQEKPEKQSPWRTFAVFASWITLNAIFVTLYFVKIIDGGILIIISLFYSVCDMICILFFCPFQTWMMKNRCCVSCRIYNWDYAMMFTPVVFLKWTLSSVSLLINIFSVALFAIAIILLIQWEILYRKHPERFCRNTNEYISCANCKEKLCKHKRQLQSFIKKLSTLDKTENKD